MKIVGWRRKQKKKPEFKILEVNDKLEALILGYAYSNFLKKRDLLFSRYISEVKHLKKGDFFEFNLELGNYVCRVVLADKETFYYQTLYRFDGVGFSFKKLREAEVLLHRL